ncbi:MAG: DNA/RNA nuclease SfsA [Microcoleaceae cyanobacterium]
MTNLIYQYPPLISGILLKRYKRFLADIELDSGEVITAHCPNTGPMTGVCAPGSPVFVSQSSNPKRKLPYTWELIQVNDLKPTWVGINTALPNRIIKLALHQGLLTEFADYPDILSEVPYGEQGKSRIDFLLQKNNHQIYLEVKNTTLSDGEIALFPDTVTTRGQKHLRELIQVKQAGARAAMLYFINRNDCTKFAPGDKTDPKYGELLRVAVEAGVEVIACRFDVQPTGIAYLGLADLDF